MRRFVTKSRIVAAFLSGLATLGTLGSVRAQVLRELPQLEDVGVTERIGASIPPEIELTDESGRVVRMGDLVGRGRPAVVILGYYGCPMLCGLVLNGFLDAAKASPWTVGRDYDVVYVTIDPNEQPPLAAAKKAAVLESYGRAGSAEGWHFLTARADQSAALAAAVGFGYRWVPERNEWAHPSVLTLVGADGRIGRYLYGVQFDPRSLRIGLTEAGRGESASMIDRLILYCFHYDANEGRYVVAAQNIMRVAGAFTLVAMAAWLVPFWIRSARGRGPGSGFEPPDSLKGVSA